MSVYSKMTALANEIRELSGTEEAMGLDDMAEHVGEANTDVATEADLIAQIAIALEGKAAGSGGVSVEAWTGTVCYTGELGFAAPSLYYTDETLTTRLLGNGSNIDTEITIAAGTALFFSTAQDFVVLDNAEEITLDNDKFNYMCSVVRPTANGFAISN